jgi:predicted phosphoribosyltransferase
LLAEKLAQYRYDNCAVVALSEGGVLVGEQIAVRLHCVLMMLLSEGIEIPGEGLSFGAVSQSGDFTYNSAFSDGEIDGYTNEFHSYLEEQKREAYQKLNRLIGDGGVIDKDMLRDRTVILVSDGLGDNLSALDVALGFLKSIRIERLVVAVPVCDVSAVDRLHITVDDLHILDVKGNYMGTDHYYDDNLLPSLEETVEKINQVILNWR